MGNTLQNLGQNNSEKLLDESQSFSCEICMEPMLLPNKNFKNQNRCVHPFCTDCIVKYISVKLEDNVVEIPCPSLKCNQFLDPIYCKKLVGPELFVKWSDKLCESYVLGLTQCYCPNRNCSALILDECGENATRSHCPNCKRFFCFQCKLPWHAGFKCEESGEFRDENDVAFGVLAVCNEWKRCPHCRRFVSKIDGCRFVQCRCCTAFCYKCGRQSSMCACDYTLSWTTCCLVSVIFSILALLILVFRKQHLYLPEVVVKSVYTLPSPDLICGILLGMLLLLWLLLELF